MLRPGTRVVIHGEPSGITLQSHTGTIVGPDPLWEGYSIMRLDIPALYHRPDGQVETLPEIREDDENLDLLSSRQ
jgi:hypothetical protein